MDNSGISQTPGIQASKQSFLDSKSGAELDVSDPRWEVCRRLQSGELKPGDGTSKGNFLQIIKDSWPGISLRDLPFEVASTILDSQSKTMKAFFDSWSESIEKNARLDRETSKKAQETKAELKKVQQSRSFLASSLQRAVNTAQLSPSAAQEIKDRGGFTAQHPELPLASIDGALGTSKPNDPTQGLVEPSENSIQFHHNK